MPARRWSTPLRILTVSAFYEGHGGGIEIVAGATARALARLGHECRWAAAGFDAAPNDPLLQPVPLPMSDPLERWTGLPMPVPGRSACRSLEREVTAADVVIIHDALYVSSVAAARYAKNHGKPWVMIQHIGAIPYTNPLLRMAMATANAMVAKPLLAKASQAVFISDAVRQYFAGGDKTGASALLLNGVEHGLFRNPTAPERARLRKRFNMSGENRHLLFVGRFVEKKGLMTIRALATERPEWNFWLVGTGAIDPANWGLANVHPLGRKSREELADLYRAADALLLPSVGEGFPLVVQEAMASGLPVFCGLDSAAADPGARQLVHSVEVEPSNPAKTAGRFAAAIERAPSGPDGQLAAYARATYDWDANARWLEDRFRKLLAAQSANACQRRSQHENTLASSPPRS